MSNQLGQDDSSSTSSNTPSSTSNFFWQNWPWILLATFTGLSGMWVGWEIGKLRCGALYYWDKTKGAIKGTTGKIKSGISGAADTVSSGFGSARKSVGLKKKKSRLKRKK